MIEITVHGGDDSERHRIPIALQERSPTHGLTGAGATHNGVNHPQWFEPPTMVRTTHNGLFQTSDCANTRGERVAKPEHWEIQSAMDCEKGNRCAGGLESSSLQN